MQHTDRQMPVLSEESWQSSVRAGVARRDVTPPVGIYHRMWGAARHDRSTGVHRPLTATALALAPQAESAGSAGAALAIVSLDHCLLWGQAMDQLLASVCRVAGLNPAQLRICFTHTHGAGLMGLDRVELPGGELIPAYLQRLGEEVGAAVREALASLQAAEIVYGTGSCRLARHRDLWDDERGQWVCGYNPSGRADETLLAARVGTADGRVLATLVNYACHPTTLAWDNTLISPDYVGALRELVERETQAPCLFLQGASGDLGPREGFVGDPAVADRNGREVGFAALAVLEGLPPANRTFAYDGPVVSGATIGVWSYRPRSPAAVERAARWRLQQWTVPLAYRPGLPTVEELDRQLQDWRAREQAAKDALAARDCRAQIERLVRQRTRVSALPVGGTFPFECTLLSAGDALWVFVESEHYQLLQQSLRARAGGRPVLVATLAGGSRPTYLPQRIAYGTGIYQETVALLQAGCLERLCDEIGDRIAAEADLLARPGAAS